MKNSKLTISIITVLTVLISYFLLKNEIDSFEKTEDDLILGSLLSIGFFIAFLTLVGVAIYSIIQVLKKKNVGFLIPLSICLVSLLTTVILWSRFQVRESSQVILKARYDGDINGINLYLRKNNTYKLEDFSFLGGTSNYGEYEISGDTIILSKEYPLGEERKIMNNKLLRTNSFILIRHDSNGVYDKDEYLKLTITENNAINNK